MARTRQMRKTRRGGMMAAAAAKAKAAAAAAANNPEMVENLGSIMKKTGVPSEVSGAMTGVIGAKTSAERQTAIRNAGTAIVNSQQGQDLMNAAMRAAQKKGFDTNRIIRTAKQVTNSSPGRAPAPAMSALINTPKGGRKRRHNGKKSKRGGKKNKKSRHNRSRRNRSRRTRRQ